MKKIILICNQIIIFSNFVMSEVLRYHWRWLVLHEWNWHYFFSIVRSPHITPSIKTSNNSFANIHSSTVQLQRKNHKNFSQTRLVMYHYFSSKKTSYILFLSFPRRNWKQKNKCNLQNHWVHWCEDKIFISSYCPCIFFIIFLTD